MYAVWYMARWLSWLERRPVTAEVVGSSPIRVVFHLGVPEGALFFVSQNVHNIC